MDRERTVPLDDLEVRFRRMYETALPIVYGFVAFRVGGDRELAEDVTSETFAAAVNEYRAGRADSVTNSWLRTVANRRLVDHWRRQRVARSKALSLVDRQRDDHNPKLGDREIVIGALAALPQDQRTALILQHIEGYSVAEVADILGRTEKATESLLSRARASFRTSYAEADHV